MAANSDLGGTGLPADKVRDILEQFAGPAPRPKVPSDGLVNLRRGRRSNRDTRGRIALVEHDGLLEWRWGTNPTLPHAYGTSRLRAGRAGRASGGTELFSRDIEPLGENEIGRFLLNQDSKLNDSLTKGSGPKQGWTLRQWYSDKQELNDPANLPEVSGEAAQKGRGILVIVHGTASSTDHILEEIRNAPDQAGGKFLADASKLYDAVLAFDHPTLAFSPMLNALDLAAALEPYGDRNVDIICHSRGGLVSSWWINLVDRRPRLKRCVFVGSPLQGTSLANSARLRQSLNLLSNYGKLLGNVGHAAGFVALPFTILKVVCSAVDVTSKLPLLDAAFALIPGLNAQSMIDNNYELKRLQGRSMLNDPPRQFYIQSNFNSKDEGWKIWKYFNKLTAADAVVDKWVFAGENDLVVDTHSMIDIADGPKDTLHKFGDSDSDSVHHTNYFRQTKTLDLIRAWFSIP